MASEKKDTVILTTSDDENFTVERKVAERSVLIKSMLDGTYEPPLPSRFHHSSFAHFDTTPLGSIRAA